MSRWPWRAVAAAALAVTAFGFVQTATPHPVGVDGLFHIQSASLARENLPRPWMNEFRWLEYTSLRHDLFADFYWGFHVLLIPFTLLRPEPAAKLAPVVLSSASMMALYFVLFRLGVRHRLMWFALALLSSPIFLMRLSVNKAPTVMLGLIVLLAWAVVEGRRGWSAALGAAMTWVYPVLPLIAAVIAAGAVARAHVLRRVPWRVTSAAVAGCAAALVIHPDFPRNLGFLVVNLIEATSLKAGEFNPLRTDAFLGDLWILAVLFLLAFRFAPFRRDSAASLPTWGFFLSSVVVVLVALRYMRGIDFLPPFVVIFAALALDVPVGRLFDRSRQALGGATFRPLVVAVTIAAVVAGAGVQLVRARRVASRNSTVVAHRLAGAAGWLAQNTAPGELVLNLSAGDFEQLWAYNTHNTYWVGFNVRFLQSRSPELFGRYARVYERGDLAALHGLLTGGTPARYALASDRLPGPLLQAIASSTAFETVYTDAACVVVQARY